MKKTILRFITTLLAITLCLSIPLSASAAEKDMATDIETVVTPDESTEEPVRPYGSLSGYGQQYTNGNISGSFEFNVTGSWSPWAGCTVKFDDFPAGSVINFRLVEVSSGRWMFGNSDRSFTVTSSDNEDNNIPLLNVSPGTYRLMWTIVGTERGTVRCYIY